MNFSLGTAAAWYLTAIVVSTTIGYWGGYQRGATYERALTTSAAAEMLAEQEQALREELQQQIDQANATVRELRANKAAIEQRATELEERIDYVTTHYRPAPAEAPQPLPDCRFTAGFVGLYNAAISPAVPVPGVGAAAGTDGAASPAAAADPLSLSAVRQPDILHHITGYGSRCQAIEAQLNRLIDYLQATQGRTE